MNSTLKVFSLIFLMVWVAEIANSQPLANYTPPTPMAAQFEKYINYPVDHTTGAASVDVPLYTLKAGGIQIPVSLSYHTSGVKPGDLSLPVGLGWTINPGARITRKIMNYPDEMHAKPPANVTVDLLFMQNMEYGHPQVESSGRDTLYDPEYDIFTYYTGTGVTGRFIIQKQGNEYIAVPLILTKDRIKIYGNGGIDYFEITDASGVLYRFGVGMTSYSIGVPGHPTTENLSGGFGNTGWMLTDIVSADKSDTVSLKWKNISNNSGSYYKTTDISDQIIITDQMENGPPGGDDFTTDFLQLTNWHFSPYYAPSSLVESYNLMNVIAGLRYKNQEVKLIYTEVNGVLTQLTQMEVYSLTNKIRQIDFHKSLFTNDYLRLDSISIRDKNNQVVSRYKFGYNTEILLPAGPSRAIDYWGYYNGASNNSLIPDFQYTVDPGGVPGGGTTYTQAFSTANRLPNINASAYILNSITYPTGGKTTYEYELNQIENKTTHQAVLTGGLRVAKINHWIASGQLAETRSYTYGLNECGYGDGEPMAADMFVNASRTCLYENGGLGATFRKRVLSGSLTGSIFMYDFPPVTYRQVTEYIGDKTGSNSGKIIYKYSLADYSLRSFVLSKALHTYMDRYWNKPRLLTTMKYKNNQGVYTLVKKDSIDYIVSESETISSWIVRRFANFVSGPGAPPLYYVEENFLTYFPSLPSVFDLTPSYVYRGVVVPLTEHSTDYTSSGESIITIKTYNYTNNEYLYPESISITNSNGTTTTSHFKYPKDYTVGSSPANTVAQGIKLLKDRNVVAPVIEEYTEVQPANKIKSGKFITYKTDKPVPDQVFTLTPGGTASSYTPATITSSSHSKSSSYYLTTTINAYDSHGNVQQATDEISGMVTSMQYSLDGQHVYAQATNAKTSEIFFESFEDEGTWNSPVVRDAARKHTGNYSGRITNTSSGESTAHSTKWLTISSGVARKFHYSAWIYSNGPSAELFLFMKRNGETGYFSYVQPILANVTNKWVYVENDFEVPADVTQLNIRIDNNGAGTIWFDDIRLHPSNAMMTSYTHDPVAGVTSVSDINSKPTYYEYDGFNRLTLVRDDLGNIIKKVCYNYAGQPEDCGTYYTNVAKSGTYTRNNCASGATAGSVTYTVAAGTYSSTISQADADAKAQNDVNTNGQAYANANATCTWYSVAKSGSFTRNNCASGGTGGTITYNVSAGAYSSTISQADADSKAQNDVSTNGQSYANTNASCTWYSVAKSGNFTRNNCAAGGVGGTVTYTVAAGTYSSTTSQAAADQLAQNAVNANGQAYANANASCTWYNVAKSGNFTKNNCASGGTGSTVTYNVAASAYSSTISQADADSKAQNDVNTNGQAYANANGTCTWYNNTTSGNFTRNNCSSGSNPETVNYIVPYGTYSSTISQAAADALAQADVNANGQNYANTHGTCEEPLTPVYTSNNTGNTYSLTFWNSSTGLSYNYTLYPYSSPTANIPIGTYTIAVSDNGSGSSAYIDILGYSTYGMFQYVSNVSIGAGYDFIYMSY